MTRSEALVQKYTLLISSLPPPDSGVCLCNTCWNQIEHIQTEKIKNAIEKLTCGNVISGGSKTAGSDKKKEERKKGIHDVGIKAIEVTENGWVARGFGTAERQTKTCDLCGTIFQSIIREIPVLCKPFPCPECDSLENVKYKINSIRIDEESFEFQANIICEKCKGRKTLKKIIKGILDLIKIEVKPTGITLKSK